MEKYGFVYIWYDSKRKMYYIGCHWGTEDDGYICSSNRMRDAYRRRPEDFRRRIISKIYTNRDDLHEEEHRLLQMIDDSELGKKYYNLTNYKNGHWTAYPEKVKTLKEKISHNTKQAMQRDDVRERYEAGLTQRDNKSSDPEVREKRRQSMLKTMAEKFPVENRNSFIKMSSEERTKYYRDKAINMHTNRSEEKKKEIGKKISEAQKANPRPRLTCPHCKKEGGNIAMKRWHFTKCKKAK